jgi:hypothetical protein
MLLTQTGNWESRMVRTKHEIWKRFGDPFHLPASLGDDDSTTKSKYCKCNLCNELVIAASARLKYHWDKCKKRPRAIGQLDAGFQYLELSAHLQV